MDAGHGYRYPGAGPFQDSDLDRKLFCGRAAESEELLHLLLSERLVVLYGRSGVGKSSLVNAGVLEDLRRAGLAPIKIRLNDPARGCLPAIFAAVADAAAHHGWECHTGDTSSLWRYFKTLELWHGDTLLVPMLVFDQFEELFTLQTASEREVFIREFAGLVRGADLPGVDAPGEGRLPDVKVLLSLREDFLPNLEELSRFVPHILNRRFRLEQLSPAQATDAIREPAAREDPRITTPVFTFADDAIERLVGFLSAHDRGASSAATIEPFQLQIVCRKAEELVRSRAHAGVRDLRLSYADLGGDAGLKATLRDFYTAQVNALKPTTAVRRAFRLCATGLINPEGRRLSLEGGDIHRRFQVTPAVLDELVERRVLRADPRMGSTYYELSHDSLVTPVREDWRRRRTARVRLIGLTTAAVILVGVGTAGRQAYLDNARHNLSDESDHLTDLAHGDQTVATAMAVDVAARLIALDGRIGAKVNKALTDVAGASQVLESAELPPGTTASAMSGRGEFIVAGDTRGGIHVLDAQGAPIMSAAGGVDAPIVDVAIGERTNRVATLHQPAGAASPPVVQIWSLGSWTTPQSERTVPLSGFPAVKMAFSPDERSIAVLGDTGAVLLVDAATGQRHAPATTPPPSTDGGLRGPNAILAFRGDGRWLAASASPYLVRLWYLPDATHVQPTDRTVESGLFAAEWAVAQRAPAIAAAAGPLVFVQGNTGAAPARVLKPIPAATDAKRASTDRGGASSGDRAVKTLAMDASGRFLATVHNDGRVRLVELSPDGDPLTTSMLTPLKSAGGATVAVDGDGNVVASSDDDAPGVWSRSGAPLYSLTVPSDTRSRQSHVTTLAVDDLLPAGGAGPAPGCRIVLAGLADGSLVLFPEPQATSAAASSTNAPGGAGPAAGSRAAATLSGGAPGKPSTGASAIGAAGVLTRLGSSQDPNSNRSRDNSPTAIAVSPAQDLLAIGDYDGRIELWKWQPQGLCGGGRWQAPPAAWRTEQLDFGPTIDALRFSADGQQLLAAADDDTVRVWNTTRFPAGARDADGAAIGTFDLSGATVTIENDGTVQNAQPARTFGRRQVVAARFRSETQLAVGDEDGTWISYPLDFTPPGDTPPAPSSLGAQFGVRSTASQRPVPRYGLGVPAAPIEVPEGDADWLTVSRTGLIQLDSGGDTPLGVQAPLRAAQNETVAAASLLDDDRQVALLTTACDAQTTPCADPRQSLWTWRVPAATAMTSTDRADPAALLPAHTISSEFAARKLVDPSGRYFATFTNEDTPALAVYDKTSGRSLWWIRTVRLDSDPTFCGDVTAAALWTASRLLIGCHDGSVTAISDDGLVLAGERFTPTDLGPGAKGSTIRSVIASASGRIIAAGTDDGDVLLWKDGRFSRIKGAHAGRVLTLDISPDERWLASGGNDGDNARFVKLWSLSGPTAEHRVTFSGHTMGEVNYVEFSPDGRSLLSAGDDGTVQVWDVQGQGDRAVRVLRHVDDRNTDVPLAVYTARFAGDALISQTFGPQFTVWDAAGDRMSAARPTVPALGPADWFRDACAALGSQPTATEDATATPDRAAAFARVDDACRRLLASADGVSVVEAATMRGDLAYLAANVHSRIAAGVATSSGQTLLHLAAASRQPAAVRYLLGLGVEVDARDRDGRTPLVVAVQHGDALIARLLLDRGARPDATTPAGDTPLHLAAMRGDMTMVSLLLAHRAPAAVADALGVTPLMNAARAGGADVVSALASAGADVNARDCAGNTALMDAVRAGSVDVVKLLLARHADINAQTLAARPRDRKTALLIAIGTANAAIVDLLRADKPMVTTAFPTVTVRYPVARYLPAALKTLAPNLAPWEDVGQPGPGAGGTVTRLKAQATNPFVEFLLGRAYEVGIGVTADEHAAMDWYRRSAAGGEALGAIGLAMADWSAAPGITQNLEEARQLLEKLADAQHPLASVFYAQLLRQCSDMPWPCDADADRKAAIALLQAAAATGDPVAENSYGAELASEPGMLPAAFEWYQKAADQHDSYGLTNVASAYLNGAGVAPSYAKALALYQQAALVPRAPNAAWNLGYMYYNGLGVEASRAQALEWFRKASLQDDAPAELVGWILDAEAHGPDLPSVEALRAYYRASIGGAYLASERLRALTLKP